MRSLTLGVFLRDGQGLNNLGVSYSLGRGVK